MVHGITYDDVAAATNEALAEGKYPSMREVRERLGKGSMNTIQKHLAQWRASTPPITVPLPELPAVLLRQIAQAIEQAVAEGRAECEKRLASSQDDLSVLSANGEELEAKLTNAEAQRSHLDARCQELLSASEQKEAEIEKLSREIVRERQTAEEARVGAAKSTLTVEAQGKVIAEHAAEIGRLQSERDVEIERRISAEQAAAVLGARLDAAKDQLEWIRRENEQLSARVDQERQDAATERSRADKQQNVVADLREQLAGAKMRIELAEAPNVA
jgi:colicin import membrane protein